MSSPDCKRPKVADNVNSVANMSKILPMKDFETQTGNATNTPSTSKQQCVINISGQQFEEIAKSDSFVDRTILIEELLEHKPTKVMMFAPSKFGKTINLNMIRLFCDIEDKTRTKEDVAKDPTMDELRSNPSENMKVFLRQFEDKQYEECLILKREQFVIQHFGRHPVVYFNFKDCSAKNESEVIFFCAMRVQNAYLKHKYLENSKEFQCDDPEHALMKERCLNWMNYNDKELKSLSLLEVAGGLKNLIKSLNIHWGREPVFLVDEVDKPCVFALECKLSEDEVHQIETVITNVLGSILKPESGRLLNLQAALVTGICKFVSYGQTPPDNTTPVYFLSDARFSKYYGLTAQEVDTLVERLCGCSQGDTEKTEIIKDINARYNGYYQLFSSSGEDKNTYARYCVFFILNYIQERNKYKNSIIAPFWSDGSFLTGKFVRVIKKDVEIMSAIQILLFDDDSASIEIEYRNVLDVTHILRLYREEISPDTNEIFNYFLQRGYLTYNADKPIENTKTSTKVHVRIPNMDIRNMYKEMFENCYRNLQKDILLKLTFCGDIFKSLHTPDDSTQFQKSLNELCENLKYIFKCMKCINKHTICSHILTILKYYAEYGTSAVEYRAKCSNDNNKSSSVQIDVWGRHGDFAIIFEVKFNSGAIGECEKIGSKTKSSLAAAEDIVKLLPGKDQPEDRFSAKAGTGRDLDVLEFQQIKNYVLIGLAVDGDYTTHMLVFRNTTNWENVIQVNTEYEVAREISSRLEEEKRKEKIPVV